MLTKYLDTMASGLAGVNLAGEVEDPDRWEVVHQTYFEPEYQFLSRDPNKKSNYIQSGTILVYDLSLDAFDWKGEPVEIPSVEEFESRKEARSVGKLRYRQWRSHHDPDDFEIRTADLEVDPFYRRMGIATLMYSVVDELYGYEKAIPAPFISTQAHRLRQSLDRKYGTSHLGDLSGVNLSGEVENPDRWEVHSVMLEGEGSIEVYDRERWDSPFVGILLYSEWRWDDYVEAGYDPDLGVKVTVDRVFVLPDYRRMGIATLMYAELADEFGYENVVPYNLTEMGKQLRRDLDRKYQTS